MLPFQFHDYIQPAREELRWLFITFDMIDVVPLQALRFRPFVITQVVRQTCAELVEAYLTRGEGDLTSLLLSVLLQRIRQAEPILRRHHKPLVAPGLIMQVNQLAQNKEEPMSVKEIARSLGISASHLRARFRASCGVSLGRHLRRLRLEKACGLASPEPEAGHRDRGALQLHLDLQFQPRVPHGVRGVADGLPPRGPRAQSGRSFLGEGFQPPGDVFPEPRHK